MRRYHLLKTNASRDKPKYAIFVDTESWQDKVHDGVVHRLRIGVARYVRFDEARVPRPDNELVFDAVGEFWDFVVARAPKRSRLYLVAHNWNFDFLLLNAHAQLESRGWTLHHWYQKGTTTMITYRREHCTLKITDNMNLFPMALRTLGSGIGTEKGKVDFANVDDVTLYQYCRQDVQVMIDAWTSWLAFLERYDLGNFAPTLASQAFNAYRHKYMHHKIYIHANDTVTRLERDAYHGGRVEVLRQGRFEPGPFYKLDVNAMYPAIMHDHEFPTNLSGYREDCSVEHLARLAESRSVVARVTLHTDEPWYPLVVDNHRCYPVGHFTTTLTTPELRLVLAGVTIEAVHAVAVYDQAPLFVDWVDWVWQTEQEARRAGDATLRFQCKLLRNSLYGKFGQRDLERELLGEAEGEGENKTITYCAPAVGVRTEYNFAGKRWRDTTGIASFNAFVAIAAHVTALARIDLWGFVCQAGQTHVYYIDTDSLIVDQVGYDRLHDDVDPDRLGALKLEGTASSMDVWAAKDYRFGDEEHHKGISSNAVALAANLWQQQEWPGLTMAWSKGETDYVYTHTVTKLLARQVFTGMLQPDGQVWPYVVDEAVAGVPIVTGARPWHALPLPLA